MHFLGPDGQTDRRICMNGSNPPPNVNAKCDVIMKLSAFSTQTDTHRHTRQNLYILALRAVNSVGCTICKLLPKMIMTVHFAILLYTVLQKVLQNFLLTTLTATYAMMHDHRHNAAHHSTWKWNKPSKIPQSTICRAVKPPPQNIPTPIHSTSVAANDTNGNRATRFAQVPTTVQHRHNHVSTTANVG